MASNYEKMCDSMRVKFLESDQDIIIRTFSLQSDGDHIMLRFLGDEVRIIRSTGSVEIHLRGEWVPAGFDDSMSVYDLLSFSDHPVIPSGEYVNLSSLAALSGASFSHTGRRFFAKEEKSLAGKTRVLKSIFEKHGWEPEDRSDAGCIIPVFAGLKTILRFWAEDEDFPVMLDFLWDRSILEMMHYETVWFASSSIVRRIMDDLD